MSTFRIAVATTLSVFAMSAVLFGAAAQAQPPRFLAAPVDVLAAPDLTQPAGNFDFAQSETGAAVAFWGQNNGMYAAIRQAGAAFSTPVQVSPTGSGSSLPRVAMAPDGTAVVTWRQTVSGRDQVMAAVKPPTASGFTVPVQVSEESFQVPNLDPKVSIAGTAQALVVWRGYDVDGDDDSARVRQRRLSRSGDLAGFVETVSPVSATGVNTPGVSVGAGGHSLVTWVIGDTLTGDPATYYQEPPNGGAGDFQSFDLNSGYAPVGAVDASGNAVIAIKDGNQTVGNSRAAGPGKDFIFDQNLARPGTASTGRPTIGVDGQGRATVAFGALVDGKWGIQVADRPAGATTTFGDTANAVTQSEDVEKVGLAVGPTGLALLGWVREDGRVYVASRGPGAPQFSVQTGPVSPAGVGVGAIRPAVGDGGRGLVSFSLNTGGPSKFSVQALPFDDVPRASGLSIPGTATQGVPVTFSVSPADPWAALSTVTWQIDDGLNLPGNQVTHTYMTPGDRMVVLELADEAGNKTTVGGLVQVEADTTPPKLGKVTVQKRRMKRRQVNAFRFTLAEPARVAITVRRISRGKGRKLQGKIVRGNVAAGKRRIKFRARIGKRGLKPARYRATIIAADRFGNKSKARKVVFRVVR